MAAAMDHVDRRSAGHRRERRRASTDLARLMITADVAPGQPLRVVKFLAYGWSAQRSLPALRDQVARGARRGPAHRLGRAARRAARLPRRLLGARRRRDRGRRRAPAGGALRALFHVPAGRRPRRAARDPGQGPDRARLRRAHVLGHRDASCCRCSPTRHPTRPRDALRWRHADARPGARAGRAARASQGAAFPWRTIDGQECSGYWPAGTAAFHVNADIADAVVRYLAATDDDEFEREVGLELLVETARLWRSLGHHDADGRVPHRRRHRPGRVQRDRRQQRLHQPDGAAEPARGRRRGRAPPASAAAELGVDDEETAGWRDAARGDVHPLRRASSASTPRPRASPSTRSGTSTRTTPEQYPLLLHFPYFDLYRKQVVKQADLVLAMHLRGDAFTRRAEGAQLRLLRARSPSATPRCRRARRRSSRPRSATSSWPTTTSREAALIDLDDLEHNTRDGLHIASLAGTWIAAVAGFGGMRDHDGALSFAPRLPQALTRLAFRLVLSRAAPAGRGRPRAGHVLAARRRAARDRPSRPAGEDFLRSAGGPCDPSAGAARGPHPAAGTGARAAAPAPLASSGSAASISSGAPKPIRSTAPPPGALAASTKPPCASAAWRTIASPRPDPGFERASRAR